MTDQPFTYEMFEEVRKDIHSLILKSFSREEKEFVKSFVDGYPVWIDPAWAEYPGIRWKLMNINKLKLSNPKKHHDQVQQLHTLFSRKIKS